MLWIIFRGACFRKNHLIQEKYFKASQDVDKFSISYEISVSSCVQCVDRAVDNLSASGDHRASQVDGACINMDQGAQKYVTYSYTLRIGTRDDAKAPREKLERHSAGAFLPGPGG
jgi:hypothetical protein